MLDTNKLKQCREKVDKNLVQFCKRTGVPYRTWNHWEHWERTPREIARVVWYLNSYTIAWFKRVGLKPFTRKDIENG